MWIITTIDRAFGSELVNWEYWVHRENESIRRFRCDSRAEAEYLKARLAMADEMEERNVA